MDLTNVLVMTSHLVAIMNPIGKIPIVALIVENLDAVRVRKIFRVVGIAIPTLMIIFALTGKLILEGLGVSVDAFRIAGGILLMAIAIDTLRVGMPKTAEIEPEEFILVPVVTPMIVGPGTITTLILLSTTYPIPEVILACLLSSGITYILIRYSRELSKLLGKSLLRLIGRFMSLIIAALAIQMILIGISNFLRSNLI